MKTEIWKSVPGYEGHYIVSNRGVVASVKGEHKELTPLRQASGHLGVGLCLNGAKKRHRIHSLVLQAFRGERQPGQEVRHLDGDPENNRLENLVYGSSSENKADAYTHGARKSGQQSHLAKVSDTDMAALKAMNGVCSSGEAAKRFGLSGGYVREVWRGEARSHQDRESYVEARLVSAVKQKGGEVRKLAWVGRSSAPDRVVMLPGGVIIFVELKKKGGAATFPSNGHERRQLREHDRMRSMGQRVVVIDSLEGVEELLA